MAVHQGRCPFPLLEHTMAADMHTAAKMLVLAGIKKLASDAATGALGRRAKPNEKPDGSADGDETLEDPAEEAAEIGLDNRALPAGHMVDEDPDVEDMGDSDLAAEEDGEPEDASVADDDIEKKKAKLAKMK